MMTLIAIIMMIAGASFALMYFGEAGTGQPMTEAGINDAVERERRKREDAMRMAVLGPVVLATRPTGTNCHNCGAPKRTSICGHCGS